jgi:hypothetical protein
MADKNGIELTAIAGFSGEAAERLSALWITTAEELVSTARQEGGPQGLAEYLDLPEDEVTDLVELATAALPDDVSFAPDDVLEVGLGALDEPEGEDPDDEPVSFDVSLPSQTNLLAGMPPVRNQKNRGTCVAFSTIAVREYLLGPESGPHDLSEQYQYWNCKQRDGYDGSGTWIKVGMAALEEDGVCTEQVWPYHPNKIADNESQGPPPQGASSEAGQYRIGSAEKLQPRWVNDLKSKLAEDKPIAFAVPVFKYWLTEPARSTGDIRLPLPMDEKKGGHAMCMIGYEDDPAVPGGGYFLVRNSWGTSTWGKDSLVAAGHGRIPYAYMTKFGKSAYTASLTEESTEDETGSWLDRLLRRLFG